MTRSSGARLSSSTQKAESWTIRKVLDWTRTYLAEKGVENSRLEAEWLLAETLRTDRMGLYLNLDKPLHAGELAAFRAVVARRARREPLQYILGTQEFMGLDFKVTPAVLIPRHDTEVLVEEALRRAAPGARILDIGTGSGCIAIVLAKRLAEASVVAVDISAEALGVARENAAANDVTVDFRLGSLLAAVRSEIFDVIVSNPPYIPAGDLAGLQPEVRDFEPPAALDGGADGLEVYRVLVPEALAQLAPGGWLVVELGIGQAEAVADLFRATGFMDIFTSRDPGSIDRVVGGRRP